MKIYIKALAVTVTLFTWTGLSYGWSCPTHSFIAHQAGLSSPDTACITDAARYDNYNLLVQFHYHNAAPGTVVTPQYIDQYTVSKREYIPKGDPGAKPLEIMVPADSGVLYWKIVDLYRKLKATEFPSEYNYALMTISHLIGDLSQPLHNFPYMNEPASDGKAYPKEGSWAGPKEVHGAFDNRFDEIMPAIGKARMANSIKVSSEDDLKREIAKIANASIALANRCYSENQRGMKAEEVAAQVASSIVLLKAVIGDTRRVVGE
ncbi:MAG: hypothetical protein HXX17_08770 [Geobacteraceae bacterium]|nr:hypothetical protein [Geobacteraceae bacterium]